jgi:hypothetical protein
VDVVEGCPEQVTLLDELTSLVQRARKAITGACKEKDVVAIRETLRGYEATLALFLSMTSTAVTMGESTYYETPSLQVSQFVERILERNLESWVTGALAEEEDFGDGTTPTSCC